MIILPDCSHCRHYCYSHRTSLSMLQSASVGLTSIWADICCQPCRPVEWIPPRCFIHFPITEHLPCARHVTGHWRCRDRGLGSALTMVLVEGQQKRLTVCWLIYSLHAPSLTHSETASPALSRGHRGRSSWVPAPPGRGPASILLLQPSASSAGGHHVLLTTVVPPDDVASVNPRSSFYDMVLSPTFLFSLTAQSFPWTGKITPKLSGRLVWFEQV